MLLYMEEEQNMGLHTYAICIVSQGRGCDFLGNAKIWWKAYQDMLGNRARSLQSKFFFETQSPFLLLPLLLVMTSLLLLMTTEQRCARETRKILLNLILGLMETEECTQNVFQYNSLISQMLNCGNNQSFNRLFKCLSISVQYVYYWQRVQHMTSSGWQLSLNFKSNIRHRHYQ